MALTPTIRASQGATQIIAEGTEMRVSQLLAMTIANFPTPQLYASQGYVTSVTDRVAPQLYASQAMVMGVGRGRIANPKLRAWTFSLDGHDFYVLRLGDTLTLVYDLYSEQWVDWQSGDLGFWRPNCGLNWLGAQALATNFGSNVIVGDDLYGLIWFLDPDQPYDEHPDYLAPQQEIYFERITMGQVPIRGREVVPCFAAWITTDMGDPAYLGAGVTLYTSDDGGETFDDHGLVTVTPGEFAPELSWYSLGQIGAPGRLFKIVDDGAIARIDGMEMNDPDDDG